MRDNGPYDLLLSGGTVVGAASRFLADVGIRGERIVAVGKALAPGSAKVLDVAGAFVLPGVVDAHVHPIHGETIGSASEAAAFGGVTTVLHHVYPESGQSLLGWLKNLRREAVSTSLVDFALHARLRADSPEHLDEVPAAADLGIRSFKAFTAYGEAGVAVSDADLSRIFRSLLSVKGLLLVHAESDAMIATLDRDADQSAYDASDYLRSRPERAEADAVERVAALARQEGAPVYFVHVSSEAALAAIGTAREAGTRVLAETCPHYLTLEAREVLGRSGARAKIAPPLRGSVDRVALWNAINAGRIDTVASDHCGYHPQEKEPSMVTFRDAGFGMPGLETLLPVLFDAAMEGRVSLERLVDVVAESPARLFGLASKGRIHPGADADVVVMDPSGVTTIRGSDLHGAAYYSLYEGRRLRGRIARVILRGRSIVADGRAEDLRPTGRFLPTRPLVSRSFSAPTA